jgi:hypothetical protein
MNHSVKIVSASLLLILGMANVFAEPGYRREERAGRGERNGAWAQQRQERPGRVEDDQYARMPQQAPEPRHRGSNLSPEERRALRQQIHDAGREVYPPNR